jgi:hypothetical protein
MCNIPRRDASIAVLLLLRWLHSQCFSLSFGRSEDNAAGAGFQSPGEILSVLYWKIQRALCLACLVVVSLSSVSALGADLSSGD